MRGSDRLANISTPLLCTHMYVATDSSYFLLASAITFALQLPRQDQCSARLCHGYIQVYDPGVEDDRVIFNSNATKNSAKPQDWQLHTSSYSAVANTPHSAPPLSYNFAVTLLSKSRCA